MIPILKLYRGYANEEELIVMGHVFQPTKAEEYDFQKRKFKNARSVIRMYQTKTQSNADVFLERRGNIIHTKTLKDGYFKFCIPIKEPLGYGWLDYSVHIVHEGKKIEKKGTYIRPFKGNLGFISDIDDTFLVSHTRNLLKKLHILLFRNINTRKVFEGAVPHYQALSTAGRNKKEEQNAFFYVSSSEWNLYRFIVEFTELNQLPRAVLLLKDIKTSLWDFFVTRKADHNHKFEKIKHILEFYPNLNYTLLGDDSQEDPYLYENICKIFPVTVIAVYIRQTGKQKKAKTQKALENISTLGVETCYFSDSHAAIAHSKRIGLIK
jgi:phosphatidate phosphatase APP1